MMIVDGSTPFEYLTTHIQFIGWPVVCGVFYWIGKTLQQGITEYKEDRNIIRETKETVDIKTDKALVIMGETKAAVDVMMNNHLHTIEGKVDSLTDSANAKTEHLVNLLGDIKENTAVMAALMKDRQA
jgi:hypothetical protein